MIQLRDYQNKQFHEIRERLATEHRICAQSPTGSGKTPLFLSLCYAAASKGFTILVVTESTSIFEQLHAEYHNSHNIDPESRVRHVNKGHAYVAMAQTLVKRQHLVEQFASMGRGLFIINDEAHISTASKLLLQIPDAYLVGFTATPAWRWARHLPILYSSLVTGPQVGELIRDGWLCNYKHFGRVAANLDGLKVQKGEYTEESQSLVFEGEMVYKALCQDLSQIPHKKCMIFCSSIKHANNLTKVLYGRGFNVIEFHTGLDRNVRRYNIKQFKNLQSGFNICVSVGSLTKGFNFIEVDFIILMRATTSLPLYLQMMGRASRPVASVGKSWFTCVDYGKNWSRHGFYHDDRDWQELFKEQRTKQGEGVSPIKICVRCDFICHQSVSICPNCGHVFVKAPPVDRETHLVQLSSGMRIGSLTPEELAAHAQQGHRAYAIRVAKARELENPGFLGQFAQAMGYKQGWVGFQLSQLEGLSSLSFADTIIK